MMFGVSRKYILIFFSQKWKVQHVSCWLSFIFIFVTKDDVVIYLHENMTIKHLLLKQPYSSEQIKNSVDFHSLSVNTTWNQITLFCCYTVPFTLH